MQSWDALQRELLDRGFNAAAFVSFACHDHGRFRAGVAKLDPRFPCPRCGVACRANYLAEGLTRRPLPLIEEQSTEMKAPSGVHELAYVNRVRRIGRPAKLKLSKFEMLVSKWKLTSEEAQIKSRPLRAWAKAHRNHEYVPERLLSKWRLPVFEKNVTSHVQLRMI